MADEGYTWIHSGHDFTEDDCIHVDRWVRSSRRQHGLISARFAYPSPLIENKLRLVQVLFCPRSCMDPTPLGIDGGLSILTGGRGLHSVGWGWARCRLLPQRNYLGRYIAH